MVFTIGGGSSMKMVEFDENQIDKLDKIAQSLFDDELDPRSSHYKRVIIRPKVNWVGLLLWIIIPILYVSILLCFFETEMVYKICICMILTILYLRIISKWIVICMIKIYQRYAPESIRLKCRFEPSCSQYMLMAIQKYGLLKGVKQGIGRLGRCNINDGGFDEP